MKITLDLTDLELSELNMAAIRYVEDLPAHTTHREVATSMKAKLHDATLQAEADLQRQSEAKLAETEIERIRAAAGERLDAGRYYILQVRHEGTWMDYATIKDVPDLLSSLCILRYGTTNTSAQDFRIVADNNKQPL